tara:strand:- start:421 stop:774 length:354 start_codon:yes stop_codon:yes gene_type:complete
MASIYDLNITQGSQFDVRLNITDGCGECLSLSGYQVRGYVKHKYSQSGALLDLDPVIVSGDNGAAYASGLVDLTLTAAQTANLPIMQGVYDIELYDDSGFADKIMKGDVNVFPEVTK